MASDAWPSLPTLSHWQDTCETVHLWTQIVGKIRMSQMPWVNHSWHVPLYVTVRGLSTSLVPHGDRSFEIEFDFGAHRLRIETSGGDRESLELRPMSVARFYEEVMGALAKLGIRPDIWTTPVEIPGPVVPFPEDETHAAYDEDAVERYWRALLQVQRVFLAFRARFSGKVSPIHFFWGAFDLAVTRFSGRTAPPHPGGAPNCADWVMREAYSHEVSSAGFWPGTGVGEAMFYSYAYPEPEGFADRGVEPAEATYHRELGEFVLPYEVVRKAKHPDATLLAFLQSTYEAAAESAAWDRRALEAKDPR